MNATRHKVFISYHHKNDDEYKKKLVQFGEEHDLFIDCSVDTNDIDENLPDDSIREVIRDKYLRDSTVTIVLVGEETKNRKHIDWEIYSSMYDGSQNKKSGILVINLPEIACRWFMAAHGTREKQNIYPEIKNWTTLETRQEFADRYPFMPDRLLDNLIKAEVRISVTDFNHIIGDPQKLKLLIDLTANDRQFCKYDLSRLMRERNS